MIAQKEYVIKKGEEFCGIPHSILEFEREPWADGKPRSYYETDKYEILPEAEYKKILAKYYSEVCGKWKEITEKRYIDMLDILPPVKWERGGFFISEVYNLDIHPFYQKYQGRYFEAMFQLNTSREEILSSIEEYVNLHG